MSNCREIIPIAEQANVPGGLMSLDPGTVPGKRPPNFGQKEYLRLPPASALTIEHVQCAKDWLKSRD